jgi:hypothetical protein
VIAKIVLFEHTNLSGKSVTFSNAGNIDGAFNDKVSSIVVGKGTWSLYKDGNLDRNENDYAHGIRERPSAS